MTRPPHHHYKVLQLSLEGVSDDVSGKALEGLLNEYGPQGWQLRALTAIAGSTSSPDEAKSLLVTFEWNPRP